MNTFTAKKPGAYDHIIEDFNGVDLSVNYDYEIEPSCKGDGVTMPDFGAEMELNIHEIDLAATDYFCNDMSYEEQREYVLEFIKLRSAGFSYKETYYSAAAFNCRIKHTRTRRAENLIYELHESELEHA